MTLTVAQQIEQRFHLGEPLHHIVAGGDWTCDDVHAVVAERGWDLDGSGRLPRSKRVTSPIGLRFLPQEAMRAPAQPPPPKPDPPEPPRAAPRAAPKPPQAKRGPKVKPIRHGDMAGYRAHYRRRELPVCDDCQAAYKRHTKDKSEARKAQRAAEKRKQVAVECDAWFAAAQRSPTPAVRRAAAVAISALLQLRIAMDDLARAERTATRQRPPGETA